MPPVYLCHLASACLWSVDSGAVCQQNLPTKMPTKSTHAQKSKHTKSKQKDAAKKVSAKSSQCHMAQRIRNKRPHYTGSLAAQTG